MVKAIASRLARQFKALHRDEQGADMVEYVLIVAAIALPIMAMAIIFRNELWNMLKGFWEGVKQDANIPG